MSERPGNAEDRREKLELRELLDELLELVRRLAANSDKMSPEQLAYTQERLEWLADEIWNAATGGD